MSDNLRVHRSKGERPGDDAVIPVDLVGAPLPHRRRVARPRPSSSSSRACPPGCASRSRTSQAELARRRLGYGRGPRMRFEQDEVTLLGGVRHGRTLGLAGRHRDRQHRVAEVGAGDVARRPGRPRSRSPSPGPATPTWPACRSTASTTPATCSSGPRPARRRPGSRPARCAKALLRQLGHRGPQPRGPDGPGRCQVGRRGPTPADLDRGRRVAGALLRPRRRGGDDRRDQGGGQGRRLARRRRRGARPTACPSASGSHVHWDRKLDAPAGPGADEHPGGEGRRDRRRLRRRRPPGLARPTTPIIWDAERRRLPARVRPGPAASRAA